MDLDTALKWARFEQTTCAPSPRSIGELTEKHVVVADQALPETSDIELQAEAGNQQFVDGAHAVSYNPFPDVRWHRCCTARDSRIEAFDRFSWSKFYQE